MEKTADATAYSKPRLWKSIIFRIFLDKDVENNVMQSVTRTTVIVGIITAVLLIVLTVLLYYLVVLPVRRISKSMRLLVQGDTINVRKLSVRGGDEFSMMAQDYNAMTDRILDYIQTMAYINTAAHIQQGLLPKKYFENDFLRIDACMKPAKNVGGDFYDYFKLDDGRICLVIADVSGKGISAAIFMAGTVTAIRHSARFFSSPSQIMKNVNNEIASHNPEQLFVTVFIAIYDQVSAEMTYANAGA